MPAITAFAHILLGASLVGICIVLASLLLTHIRETYGEELTTSDHAHELTSTTC